MKHVGTVYIYNIYIHISFHCLSPCDCEMLLQLFIDFVDSEAGSPRMEKSEALTLQKDWWNHRFVHFLQIKRFWIEMNQKWIKNASKEAGRPSASRTSCQCTRAYDDIWWLSREAWQFAAFCAIHAAAALYVASSLAARTAMDSHEPLSWRSCCLLHAWGCPGQVRPLMRFEHSPKEMWKFDR